MARSFSLKWCMRYPFWPLKRSSSRFIKRKLSFALLCPSLYAHAQLRSPMLPLKKSQGMGLALGESTPVLSPDDSRASHTAPHVFSQFFSHSPPSIEVRGFRPLWVPRCPLISLPLCSESLTPVNNWRPNKDTRIPWTPLRSKLSRLVSYSLVGLLKGTS